MKFYLKPLWGVKLGGTEDEKKTDENLEDCLIKQQE
jgi:hypothetical protein